MSLIQHLSKKSTVALLGLGAAGIFSSLFLYLIRKNKYIAAKALGSTRKPQASSANHNDSTVPKALPSPITDEPPLQMDSIETEHISEPCGAPVHVPQIREEDEASESIGDEASANERLVSVKGDYQSVRTSESTQDSSEEIVDTDCEEDGPLKQLKLQPVAPDRLAARLAALSKADIQGVQSEAADGQILSLCLFTNREKEEIIRSLQLIGRLLQFQQHLEKLSTGGVLTEAVCLRLQASSEEDVRLHCLLCLVNLSGLPSNHSHLLNHLSAVTGLLSSRKLGAYAFQTLANAALKSETHGALIAGASGVFSGFRAAVEAGDARAVKQALTLLVNVTGDAASTRQLLQARIRSEDFQTPGPLLNSDPAVRKAWSQLLTNLSTEPDFLLKHAQLLPVKDQGEASLSSVLAWQMGTLFKQVQKTKDKLKGGEKSSEVGQQLSALTKSLRSLAKQCKSISSASSSK